MKKLFVTAALLIGILASVITPGYAIGSPVNWTPVGGASWSQNKDFRDVNTLLFANDTLFSGTVLGGVWSWNGSSWSQLGGSAGLASNTQESAQNILSLAEANGTLFAGTGESVLSWNGSSWSQVDGSNGLPSSAGNVESLDGTLYAMTYNGLWSLNGSSWSQVGSGGSAGNTAMDAAGAITCLAEADGTLYAGTFSGGVWSWNGSSWSQLSGSGDNTEQTADAYTLTVHNDTLYAGLWGSMIQGEGVWSWNGSSWSQVGGSEGLAGQAANVWSLTSVGDTLYAGTWNDGVWSWNGSSWSQVGDLTGLNGKAANVFSLTIDGSTLYAGTGDSGVFSMQAPTLPSTVEFTVGSDQYTSDGTAESVYATPFIENGRTYLGIRDMGYAIGMEDSDIAWDSTTGTATFSYDGHTVVFSLGNKSYTVDSNSQQMDVTPIDVNGHIFVPASFFAQAFGYQVMWDQAAQIVTLTLKS